MAMPLANTFVLDLTRYGPGAYCTMMLADFGARVLRVEEALGSGDERARFHRQRALSERAHPAYAPNRNKESICLNLKHPEGKAVFLRLVERADVLVEGFRPGVMARLGLGPEQLAARNPRLVYCALTGYGQDGPYVNLVGHDLNYISQGGALGLNGPPDGPPAIPGFQFADFAGGALMAVVGILLALLARQQSGRGQIVDAALTEGVLSLIANQFSYLQIHGSVPPRGQARLSGGVPYYNVYECADGKYLSIACNEPYFWANLCRLIGREDFIPDQEAEGPRRAEIFATLRAIFKTKPRDAWFELLADADVCVGRVLTLEELPADPQHRARGAFVTVPTPTGGTVTQVGIMPRLSATPGQVRRVAPRPGEQTDAILAELGYTPEQIAALRRVGAVE